MNIAYVGCSNSSVAVQGYHALGGQKFWTPSGQAMHGITYGGGTLPAWAAGGYWNTFIDLNRQRPATTVWLQVCLRSSESVQDGLGAASVVVSKLRKNIPDLVLYVSALNGFREMDCGVCGSNGPQKTRTVRDWMVAQGLAQMGPRLGALTHGQLLSDKCHPNDGGARMLGKTLLEFFG